MVGEENGIFAEVVDFHFALARIVESYVAAAALVGDCKNSGVVHINIHKRAVYENFVEQCSRVDVEVVLETRRGCARIYRDERGIAEFCAPFAFERIAVVYYKRCICKQNARALAVVPCYDLTAVDGESRTAAQIQLAVGFKRRARRNFGFAVNVRARVCSCCLDVFARQRKVVERCRTRRLRTRLPPKPPPRRARTEWM